MSALKSKSTIKLTATNYNLVQAMTGWVWTGNHIALANLNEAAIREYRTQELSASLLIFSRKLKNCMASSYVIQPSNLKVLAFEREALATELYRYYYANDMKRAGALINTYNKAIDVVTDLAAVGFKTYLPDGLKPTANGRGRAYRFMIINGRGMKTPILEGIDRAIEFVHANYTSRLRKGLLSAINGDSQVSRVIDEYGIEHLLFKIR